MTNDIRADGRTNGRCSWQTLSHMIRSYTLRDVRVKTFFFFLIFLNFFKQCKKNIYNVNCFCYVVYIEYRNTWLYNNHKKKKNTIKILLSEFRLTHRQSLTYLRKSITGAFSLKLLKFIKFLKFRKKFRQLAS